MITANKLVEILTKGYGAGDVATVENVFKVALEGNGEITHLPHLLQLPKATIQEYIEEGKKEVQKIMVNETKPKQAILSNLTPQLYFLQGYLSKNVVIGFDTTKDISSRGASLGVYTASVERITELYNAGGIADKCGKEGMEKAIDVWEKKRAKALLAAAQEGGIGVALIRLDVVEIMGDSATFEPKNPQSFNLGVGKDFLMYPYVVYPYIAGKLKVLSNSQKGATTPYRVIQIKKEGEPKKRIMTFSEKLVKSTYKVCRPELVEDKLRSVRIGWDPFSLSIKAYNLESSLYGASYTVLRLEMLKNIKECSLAEVDKSQYDINYDAMHRVFLTRVQGWTLANYEHFEKVMPELAQIETKAAKQAHVIKRVGSLTDEELYRIMSQKTFDGMFSVDKGLMDRDRLTAKEMKNMKRVELSEDMVERAKQIQDMLQNGVVKIVRTSSKSSAEKVDYGTTSTALLKKILGKNYIEKYESAGIKLRYLEKLVDAEKITSSAVLTKKIYDMELTKYVDMSKLDTAAYDRGDRSSALAMLEEGKGNVREVKKANVDTQIRYRKVNPSSGRDYFKNLDVRHIISVSYGEIEKKSV